MRSEQIVVDVKNFEAGFESQHTTEPVTKNSIVQPNGCNCIAFLNTGETAVRVLDIPLPAGAPLFSFNNDANTVERTPFKVVFTPEDGKRSELLVIRKYLTRAK